VLELVVTLNDRDQVEVRDHATGVTYARTVVASDPPEDQREALLDVLRQVGERVAEALDLDLRGVDVAHVPTE
jgi:hypothetical protein